MSGSPGSGRQCSQLSQLEVARSISQPSSSPISLGEIEIELEIEVGSGRPAMGTRGLMGSRLGARHRGGTSVAPGKGGAAGAAAALAEAAAAAAAACGPHSAVERDWTPPPSLSVARRERSTAVSREGAKQTMSPG